MKKKIDLVLSIASVIVYISVIIMKFFTIEIPDSSFVCISLLFIISEGQFIRALKSSKY